MNLVNTTVTVSPEASVEEVGNLLEAVGFRVESCDVNSKVIKGRVAPLKARLLTQIPGVTSSVVEEAAPVAPVVASAPAAVAPATVVRTVPARPAAPAADVQADMTSNAQN